MPKDIVWRWEYGVYTPFCPYCDEPAYERNKCFSCGRPYNWVDGEYQPKEITKGEYTVRQSTNHHVCIYRNGYVVMHAQCDAPKNEEELLKMLDSYEKIAEIM